MIENEKVLARKKEEKSFFEKIKEFGQEVIQNIKESDFVKSAIEFIKRYRKKASFIYR